MAEVTSSSLVGFTLKIIIDIRQTRREEEAPERFRGLFDDNPTLAEGVPHRVPGSVAHRGKEVRVGIEGHGYDGVS